MTRLRFAPLAAGALLLAACSGDGPATLSDQTLAQQLGIAKRSPDEFAVLRTQPLIVPPDFRLRPPADAAAETDPRALARARLTGQNPAVAAAASASQGQAALLQRAEAEGADPLIRQQLLQDAPDIEPVEGYLLGDILGITPAAPDPDALEPSDEAARLRRNENAGLAPAAQTPAPSSTTE